MKNGHNAVLQPSRAVPFIFNATSSWQVGFSTLRPFTLQRRIHLDNKRRDDAPPKRGPDVKTANPL